MNTETLKVLGELLKLSHDSDVQTVYQNLMDAAEPISRLGLERLFKSVALDDKTDQNQDAEEEPVISDRRIRWMSFHNFRSVPHIEKEGNKSFGVSFHDEANHPKSLFLVGRNGTGKTTLYSALEHYYISESSLSKNMNVQSKVIMTYGFEQIENKRAENTYISVETIEGVEDQIKLEKRPALCSPAPFCSEYDIQQLASKGDNLFDYLLQQIGFQELKDICNQIDFLVKQIDQELGKGTKDETPELEASDYDSIILELLSNYMNAKALFPLRANQSLFDRHYSRYRRNETPSIFSGYWQKLMRRSQIAGTTRDPLQQLAQGAIQQPVESENSMKDKLRIMYDILESALRDLLPSNRPSDLQKVLNGLYNERTIVESEKGRGLITAEDQDLLKKQRTVLMNVKSQIRQQRGLIVNEFIESHYSMLKEIMNYFSNNDAELLKPDVGNEYLAIYVKAKGEGGAEFKATPQEYYNSFRYKLYAVSFKIALAFSEMRKNHICVPVVIDDVFSASDFENNLRLEFFVCNIYKAYEKLGFEQPLQLILLTHDEMVQTSFRKGAKIAHADYLCGRLYSYSIAEKMCSDTGNGADLPFFNLYFPN